MKTATALFVQCSLISLLVAGATGASAAEPGDVAAPWPMVSGPHGNYLPLPAEGFEYIDHPDQLRKLWESEYNHFGYVKVGSAREGRIFSKIINKEAGWDSHPGSAATPIVAEGMVFGCSWRPAGPMDDLRDEGRAKWFVDKQAPEKIDRWKAGNVHSQRLAKELEAAIEARRDQYLAAVRRQAEDLVFALDAETGKLIWEAAEPGGLNLYAGKRDVWGVTPVYIDGRIIAMGTAGTLRAYEAKTGKKLWETRHDSFPGGHRKFYGTFELDLIAVDGMVIVPTGSFAAGIDPASGEVVWEHKPAPGDSSRLTGKYSNPGIWWHAGKAYLVYVGNDRDREPVLRLIDPADGRILWTRPIGPHTDPVTVVGDIAFVAVDSQEITFEKRGKAEKEVCGVRGGLRLSLEGAEVAWMLPHGAKYTHSPKPDKGVRRKASAGEGDVIWYFPTDGLHEPRHIFKIDARMGKILAEQTQQDSHWPKGPYAYQIGDRVLHMLNGAAGPGGFDAHLRRADTLMKIGDDVDWADTPMTTAYEVIIEHPIADGRIYMRTERGTLACFDVRKPAEQSNND